MRLHFILFILLIAVFSSVSFAALEFSIGVSPSSIDLGNLERGSSKIVKFYLVTPSTEPLLVYLEPERDTINSFTSNHGGLASNYSEENVIDWVEILSNPIELKPVNQTLKTSGEEIAGWREVSFLLNIPEDSEPGYHSVKVKPIPSVPSETIGQAGTRIIAITTVELFFDVPGEAIRDGLILDVTTGNRIGNSLEINTYFHNTGTTTISVRATNNIYSNGNSLINLSSSKEFVKPKETKVLKSFLPLNEVALGDYDVATKVDYKTGASSKNSTITVSERPTTPQVGVGKAFPWWIIVLIAILIIAFLIYRWYK